MNTNGYRAGGDEIAALLAVMMPGEDCTAEDLAAKVPCAYNSFLRRVTGPPVDPARGERVGRRAFLTPADADDVRVSVARISTSRSRTISVCRRVFSACTASMRPCSRPV